MSEKRPVFEFDFEWRITLFTLLFLPLLISLGFWQLQRAEEKTAMAEAFEQKRHRPPVPVESITERTPQSLAYLPVQLRGRYRDELSFLLDNRVQRGEYGNEVLTAFELDSGSLVLVNRGWMAADPGRVRVLEIPAAVSRGVVTGHVYVSPGEPYLLSEQVLSPPWPIRIQAVEMDKMARAIGEPAGGLFPYPVRIDAGQPGALSVDWQVINVSPDKHTGYAVQWFSMAAVLALIYLLRSSNLWQVMRGTPSSRVDK